VSNGQQSKKTKSACRVGKRLIMICFDGEIKLYLRAEASGRREVPCGRCGCFGVAACPDDLTMEKADG